jgi:hypothetical protein
MTIISQRVLSPPLFNVTNSWASRQAFLLPDLRSWSGTAAELARSRSRNFDPHPLFFSNTQHPISTIQRSPCTSPVTIIIVDATPIVPDDSTLASSCSKPTIVRERNRFCVSTTTKEKVNSAAATALFADQRLSPSQDSRFCEARQFENQCTSRSQSTACVKTHHPRLPKQEPTVLQDLAAIAITSNNYRR